MHMANLKFEELFISPTFNSYDNLGALFNSFKDIINIKNLFSIHLPLHYIEKFHF